MRAPFWTTRGRRTTNRVPPEACLDGDAEQFAHLLAQKAETGSVGLHPLAVNDELRDGALAHMAHYIIGGAGYQLNVDFGIGNLMLLQETLRFAAVAAPNGGIDKDVHAPHDTRMIEPL
jgi:hypothetical protein